MIPIYLYISYIAFMYTGHLKIYFKKSYKWTNILAMQFNIHNHFLTTKSKVLKQKEQKCFLYLDHEDSGLQFLLLFLSTAHYYLLSITNLRYRTASSLFWSLTTNFSLISHLVFCLLFHLVPPSSALLGFLCFAI